MVQEILLVLQNLDNQAMPGWPKSVIFKVVLQAIEANLASCIWRVSGELIISQFSVVSHLHDFSESI